MSCPEYTEESKPICTNRVSCSVLHAAFLTSFQCRCWSFPLKNSVKKAFYVICFRTLLGWHVWIEGRLWFLWMHCKLFLVAFWGLRQLQFCPRQNVLGDPGVGNSFSTPRNVTNRYGFGIVPGIVLKPWSLISMEIPPWKIHMRIYSVISCVHIVFSCGLYHRCWRFCWLFDIYWRPTMYSRFFRRFLRLLICAFDGQVKIAGIAAVLPAHRCQYFWPKSYVACTLTFSEGSTFKWTSGTLEWGCFVQYQKFIVSSTVCPCFWLI